MSGRLWVLLLALGLVLGLGLVAANVRAIAPAPGPLAPAAVPGPLQPWVPWVLHGVPDFGCPWQADGARRCLWPGRAAFDASATGADFRVTVETFAPHWIPLPGGAGLWPEDVRLGGVPVPVVMHDGQPALRVDTAGHHEIAGRFVWPRLPAALPVPSAYALVDLTLDGARAPAVVGRDGRLWLAEAPAADAAPERVTLGVHRLLHDEQPLRVVTDISLDVAGTAREIRLTGALLANAIPLQIESPLPVRLDADGSLRVQVRPGAWRITLVTRAPGPVDVLTLPERAPPWPAEEVWAFSARPELRVVHLEGGTVVDPRQTTLPEAWRGFPAFRLAAGEALRFVVERRGDPEPEPDTLALERELWLDFDGGGYTIRDRLRGEVTRSWRLEAGPALELGHVAIDGEPQFVTTLDGRTPGVEVRRGAISLEAHARHAGVRGELPAVGWNHDVSALGATLHLPPGWRLWSARGVDNVPETWLTRWTLLDLFLVLVTAAAIGRLWNRRTALLAAATLALIWQEPDAPRQVWLHLLAALALLEVLPAGRARTLARLYRGAGVAALAAIAVIFMVDQVRTGFFPQLERPWQTIGVPPSMPAATRGVANAESMMLDDAVPATVPKAAIGRAAQAPPPPDAPLPVPVERAPGALVQTGPGLPDWSWTAVALSWNGPVARDQMLELSLVPPLANLVLALLRVAALGWLVAVFLRRR